MVEQPQIHLIGVEQGPGRLLGPLDLALMGQARGLQATNTRILVAVQGIAVGQGGEAEPQGQGEQGRVSDHCLATSLRLIFMVMLEPRAWSISTR